MRLSDKLRQAKATLTDRMDALNAGAVDEHGEARVFTASEQAAWDAALAQVKALEPQIESALMREGARRDQPAAPRAVIDDNGQRHPILRSGDSLYDRLRERGGVSSAEAPNLARALRGVLTGDARGLTPVERAMGESTLPGGGYSVPAELSALWLDAVRAATVTVQAGVGTIPMATQTLRIAQIVTDLVPGFRAEGTAFPTNDLVLGAIDLRARTIGVATSASVELLADSEMANTMLVTALTNSMAGAVDAALLNGSGNTVSPADSPLGILGWAGVNAVAGGAITNYDYWLSAMNAIEVANLAANAVIDHPNTRDKQRKLKTGGGFWDGTASAGIHLDQTTLVPPPDYAALGKFMTTSMPAGTSLVGDFAWATFGIRESIIIEATRVGGGDALSKGLVYVRAYMRLDCATLRPKAFTKITGLT
jgi:HK97 family phage major capsid protein